MKRSLARSISVTTLILLNFLYIPITHAASLSAMSDVMSREKASTASDHTVKFTTPTGLTLGQTITIAFPAGFNMSTVVFGDVDLSYGATGTETDAVLAATPAGATWGAAVSGQTLTLTSGTGVIAAGNKVIVEIGAVATTGGTGTHWIVNHATPAAYTLTLGGTFADSGSLQIFVVSDDQVVMSGSIDASITFTLSANASALGTLTTGAIATAAPNITLTIGTNANSGYAITVKDQGNGTTGGLYNSGTSTSVTSATALLAAGTEGYGIQATSGNATIAAPYTAAGSNVGALQTAAQSLATYATSTAANHTVVITHKAAISTTTKAGTYADTITYIATANY